MANNALEHYYNKILLWVGIGNEIINFGMECGITNLMDYVDMNCGAVAIGEYSKVVDPDAAEQFLWLYRNIAEKRFSFAVTQVLRMGEKAREVVCSFCHDVGENNGGFSIQKAAEAYGIVNSFLLKEKPGSNIPDSIIECSDNSIVWKNDCDDEKKFWEEAGGSFSDAVEIKKSFINGLLKNSGFVYEASDENYSIVKID